MLQTLRSGAAGWVAKIFLGLLVLSFAVWGIEDIFRIGGGGDNAAEIGERKITVEEYRNAYQNEIRRISNEAKRVITPEQARMAGLGDKVLGDLVNEAAVDAKVRQLGLSLTDDQVAREIQSDEMFAGPTGSFDPTAFREILRQNNLTENRFVEMQRSFSVRRQLTAALMNDIEAPDAFRRAIHAFNSDSRTISYMAITPEAAAAIPAPGAEPLKSFYEARKSAFAAPEFRKVAILSLDPNDIASRKQIPDAELRAYFDANQPRYAELEKRSIDQIPFQNADEARAASEDIRSGKKIFEQVMVERKLKPEDAFLGNLTRGQMFDKKVADAAFALKQGEVSAPVQGSYSTVLLRVTGIQEEKAKPFEQVRDDIRQVMAQETASKEAQAIHDKIDEARLGGATLEEIAKANGLTVRVVDAIDRSGKAPDGQPVLALPLQDKLLEASFRTDQGADTEVLSEGEAFAWYDVRGVTPSRERSFEEARANVEQRWRDDQVARRVDERAAAAIAELKSGKTMEQVASAQKTEVDQSETTRMGGAPSITAEQAKAIFQTVVEGFGQTPTDDKGARLVYRVTAENERPYDPAKADDGGQTERISKSMGNDVVSALVRQLRDQLGVRFDQKAIAQVTGTAG